MDRDGAGGTSIWKHSFAFEDCCRETTTRCRGKRKTNQEIQVRRVRIMQLGAAVAMDVQLGKLHKGKVTMEEQLIQNIVMNAPKCKIGI